MEKSPENQKLIKRLNELLRNKAADMAPVFIKTV